MAISSPADTFQALKVPQYIESKITGLEEQT
jgi:hypothetical protein